MALRVGQAGRASTSARLGAADPRPRRNAQQNTNNRDVAAPLVIDRLGKLGIALGPLFQIENGQLALNRAELVKVITSILAEPLVFTKGEIQIKSAGRVENLTAGSSLAVVEAKLIELISDFQARGDLEG